MPASNPPAASHPASGRPAACGRSSGFATILVLLLIFMAMLMAITYLRTMRSYNGVHPPVPVGNAQSVAKGVIDDLAAIIGQDGKLTEQEPYDYPWTCSRKNAPYQLTYPVMTNGSGALGDPKVDDSWLAPIEPVGGVWPQVSNPFGSFLVYSDAALSTVAPNFQTRDRVPMDAPAGASIPGVAVDGSGTPQSVAFQSINTSDPRLVDTDGDGVGDALWFYPRSAWAQGVRYVAAVRVVDLSGMVNINTALGEKATPASATGGTPAKGEGPYEINAKTTLGFSIPANSLTFRQGGSSSSLVGPSNRTPSAWTDWDYWWATGGRVQDDGTSDSTASTRRYGLVDELQLRDYANQYTTTPFPVIRGDYSALSGNLPVRGRTTTINGSYEVYAPLPYAADRDPNGAGFARTRRRFDVYANQNNISTPAPPPGYPAISGTAWSGLTYGGTWDQQQFYESNWYGVNDFLRGTDNNNPQAAYPYPAGFKFLMSTRTGDECAHQYQIQMGANCFQDTLGRDNNPTIASQWSGWDLLPIMTEFYAEMPYVCNQDSRPVWPINKDITTAGALQPVLVFPGMTKAQLILADIRNLNAFVNGWSTTKVAQVFFYTAGGDKAQFQEYVGNNQTVSYVVQLADSANGVTMQLISSDNISNNHVGEDSTTASGWTHNASWVSGFSLGLPVHTDSSATTWTQMYNNLTVNRLGTGPGAVNTGGEVIWNSNNDTSTTWCSQGSAGMGSYAIEFANPYQVPVRLTNVKFVFRGQDYRMLSSNAGLGTWGNMQGSDGHNNFPIAATRANTPSFTSATLDTYVNAAPPVDGSGNTLSQDAEGYYVLKPGERIVFYRNGTENAGPGGPRSRPYGGPSYQGGISPAIGSPAAVDISARISSGLGIYKMNLTPFRATPAPAASAPFNVDAPDLNGYPSDWNVQLLEIQSQAQWSSGGLTSGWYTWLPYQRITYPSLHSGWNTDQNCSRMETNVPDGRQAAPGQVVYKQLDVRSFGADERLNMLQARPMVYYQSQNQMQTDMGDYEIRTNTYATEAKGLLDGSSAAQMPFPAGGQTTSANNWSRGYKNTATTRTLASRFLNYDTAVSSSAVSALGVATKVAFPGAATTYPAPNGTRRAYGTRQNIRAENWTWSYVGIPGASFVNPVTGVTESYPGTFPELTVAGNANQTLRDNSASTTQGSERRDGLPRPLELAKVPLVGPLYMCHYPGENWDAANLNYWGGTSDRRSEAKPSVTSPLVGNWEMNTMADALHFYLAKDVEVNGINATGLRGLCLRTDVPWFDWTNASAKYPSLNYSASATYQNGAEVLVGGEIYAAQGLPTGGGTQPAPDPTPSTGNVGVGKPWSYSNGPYARGSQFWQSSWAQVLASRWQVDSVKYKGKMSGSNSWFKPGVINLNTASRDLLKSLAIPSTANADTVADAILANRAAPTTGASVAGGVRKGLAIPSEAFGTQGMKSYTTDGALISSATSAKFYTSDASLNLETLSWLPQQATCRSDVFCAYIVIQGYSETDFTAGPIDFCRAIVVFSRNPLSNGAAATNLIQTFITRRKTTDGDPNDWYTP